MFKIPKVKYAFCGYSLEAGTKVIGIMHVVAYICLFLTIFFIEPDHGNYDGPYEEFNETMTYDDDNSSATTELIESNFTFMEEEIIHESFMDLPSSYFNEMGSIVQIVFSTYLLIGVYKKNIDYMLSWILLQLANIFFSQFFVTVYFCAIFRDYTHILEYLICEEIAISIVEGYCIIVVNSYTEELMKKVDDHEDQLSPIVLGTERETTAIENMNARP